MKVCLLINALRIAAATLFCTAALGVEVEEFRVNTLEQDVRELQRQVQLQSRRIETLENALLQSRTKTGAPAERTVARAADAGDLWLENSNWDKLRVGMTEPEILRILGPPTATRPTEASSSVVGVRTLFYATELDAGGFWSGQVVITGERVSEIRKPSLK